jgi:antitoxin (DNA-binding transcriptional repressor) of toxin-antitoxin stability system
MTRKRSDKGVEPIITKHNQPVARLVPILDDAESKFIGRGGDVITVTGDIVAPTAPGWEEGADI